MHHVPHTALTASIARGSTDSHHKVYVFPKPTAWWGFILDTCEGPPELCRLCGSRHLSAFLAKIKCIFTVSLESHCLLPNVCISKTGKGPGTQWAFSKQLLRCQRADKSTFVMWPYPCHTRQHVLSSGVRAYVFRLYCQHTPSPRTSIPNHLPGF